MNTGLVVFICCVLVAVGVTLHLRKHDMLPIIHKVVDNTTATLVADTVKTKKPVVKRDFNISGTLKDTEGNGVAGVIVSDGFKCVKTDSRGRYKMKRDSLARFIYFSVPAEFEVPTHSATDRTACFYQAVSNKKKIYDFTLRRLPGGKETSYKMIVIGDPQITNAFIDRIKLSFRKDKELYFSLYEILGFYPHDISYYKMALMHKSIMHRNAKGKPVNNERLEFLGDAVLDAVVGDIVYQHFPGKREGFLTNTRSKLVQRDTLNKLAQEMGINQLVLSNGHSSSHNSYMGGNAFEALVGAIYLDRGYDACMQFMQKRILAKMINIDKVAYKEVNFKSKLIEWSQKNRVKLDFVMLGQEKDKNGSPVFTYQVVMEGVKGGEGKGYSKKESQQLASKLTLERLRKEPQYIESVFTAKANRTKMEEEPVEGVPSTEVKEDFIISQEAEKQEPEVKHVNVFKEEVYSEKSSAVTEKAEEIAISEEQVAVQQTAGGNDEFDLSDITAEPKEMTREDIIAAAEAAAFAEERE